MGCLPFCLLWRLEDLDGKQLSLKNMFTTLLPTRYIHIKKTLCILHAFRTKWISELTSCFRRRQDREALSSTCNWPFSLLGSRSLVHTGAAENSHRSQLGAWTSGTDYDGLGLEKDCHFDETNSMINHWIVAGPTFYYFQEHPQVGRTYGRRYQV